MTEKQKKLVEDNMKLVYFVLHKYYPAYAYDEDIAQIGMLGLCKAATTFDEMKGKFSTYAFRVIKNEIGMEFRRRRNLPQTISLNYEIEGPDGDHSELINSIVGDNDVDYFDFKAFYVRLAATDKAIVDARMNGQNQKKIAEILGVGQPCISRRINSIKQAWNKFYGLRNSLA